MDKYGEWILQELQSRDWKQADLARAAHLDSAVISNLITGNRNPGIETCTAIARAFHYPPEFVFRIAGLLPKAAEPSVMYELMAYRLAELTPEQTREVMQFIDFILERDKRKGKDNE